MRIPNFNVFADPLSNDPNFPAGIVLMARGWANDLARAGYTEEKVKQFLWENSKIPWSEMVNSGLAGKARLGHWFAADGQPVPIVATPDRITIVVTGGDQAGHGYWMQTGSTQYRVLSKEVRVPAKWKMLLEQAETEMGPAPAR